ncbi:hypothetical protein C0Q70_14424 [Pomacea canaliculata]|uniref:Reverse transcriptase domain-containing protein n=1 Tax=Pomacea canaliculata TaxID=400727 RepID=A0A2T7P015_POMCA|nr:hypothetical protein C0Q70_14424 [Pomacea canaliculata]
MVEKHMQHGFPIYQNFVDFKKAFDRVWHKGLWDTLRSFQVDEGLIRTIIGLYDGSTSSVRLHNKVGEPFPMTVGVRQGCPLSPVLFNIYFEKVMRNALEGHEPSVSIGWRPLSNLRFADDIALIAGSSEELQDLTNRVNTCANQYGMHVSTEKSKVLVNAISPAEVDIKLNGKTLEQVQTFKYLGSIMSEDGSSANDVHARLQAATAAMTRLNKIWNSGMISFTTKFPIYKSLVIPVLTYGCETWTLLSEQEKKIAAFEMKCYRTGMHNLRPAGHIRPAKQCRPAREASAHSTGNRHVSNNNEKKIPPPKKKKKN